MVLFFSLVTMVIAFSMQATEYQIDSSQVLEGLTFSFPIIKLLLTSCLSLAIFSQQHLAELREANLLVYQFYYLS